MTVFSELRMRPATADRWGWDASITARLVMAGVVIFTLLVGANLATPLYPLLQAKLGITALDVTVAFSVYVLALVATLILAGHWSDHIGRRAALVLAVLVGPRRRLRLCHGGQPVRAVYRPGPAGHCGGASPPAPVRRRCASCCPAVPSGPHGSPCWRPPAAWRPVPRSGECSHCCPGPPPRRISCIPWPWPRCWSRCTCSRPARPSPRSRVRSRCACWRPAGPRCPGRHAAPSGWRPRWGSSASPSSASASPWRRAISPRSSTPIRVR